MLGNLGLRTVDKEVVNTDALGFPVDGVPEVVRVQHGVFGHRGQPVAVAAVIRPATNDGASVAVPLLDLADAVFRLNPVIPVLVHGLTPFFCSWRSPCSKRSGEEGGQVGFDTNRTRPWTTTAVRLGERLVQVEVNGIETHQARRSDAENGVEVRTVVVHLPAGLVDDGAGRRDVGLEQTEGVGVGDHHRCRGFIGDGSQGVQVNTTVFSAWNFNDFKAGHSG